jgi:hypothetical protein
MRKFFYLPIVAENIDFFLLMRRISTFILPLTTTAQFVKRTDEMWNISYIQFLLLMLFFSFKLLVVSNLFLYLLLEFSWNILIWVSVIILDLRFLRRYQDRQAYICTKLHGVTSQKAMFLLEYILVSLEILTCFTMNMTQNLKVLGLVLESVKNQLQT